MKPLSDRPYQICARCVMDTSDPDIRFDDQGVCNHCHNYDRLIEKTVLTGEQGARRLKELAEQIHRDGVDKEYDCLIGVSGGVDSTYLAYKVKELGLRPLAIHLDNGWDSELAVKNIENALKKLDIDLQTLVLDWEEFKDLQIAFLKASTPDCEIPTDHAIVSSLYLAADRMKIRYVLSGWNTRTESHLPVTWSQGHTDWRYIKSVHHRFGQRKLRSFPHVDFWAIRRFQRTQEWIRPLDYLDYVKEDAMRILEKELSWKNYGGKHHESIYTRFYQGYILPVKFGFDKRRMHISSLLCSGQINRTDALAQLEADAYPKLLQHEDKLYVAKKFGMTVQEFDDIMSLPPMTFNDYPSYAKVFETRFYKCARRVYRCVVGKGAGSTSCL